MSRERRSSTCAIALGVLALWAAGPVHAQGDTEPETDTNAEAGTDAGADTDTDTDTGAGAGAG